MKVFKVATTQFMCASLPQNKLQLPKRNPTDPTDPQEFEDEVEFD